METEEHVTLKEYFELDRNAGGIGEEAYAYEYHRGRVYALAGESWHHSLIADNIYGLLRSHFRRRGCRAFRGDVRVKTSESYVYPDITVACNEPELTGKRPPSLLNPVLVVEVLSPSTQSRDGTWKLEEYIAIATVQEYWIVSQDEPRVLRHHRSGIGWALEDFDDFEMTFRSFDLDVPLREIYEDVF